LGVLTQNVAVFGSGLIDEFPTPTPYSGANRIVTGPDGNLWYTTGVGLIGRVSMDGTISEITVRIGSDIHGIVVGPDSNLWFAETNSNVIGRMSVTGAFVEFVTPSLVGQPNEITRGSDGNLWFTDRVSGLGRVTTQGTITDVVPLLGPGAITSGPDGNLWFTLAELSLSNSIGRFALTTPNFNATFPLPHNVDPTDVTPGPDGNVWFTEFAAKRVGRITPSGDITEFDIPAAAGSPNVLTQGPDGSLWIAASNEIVVMATNGVVTREISMPQNVNGSSGITTGPDGNVWFTLPFAGSPTVSLRSEICRINLHPTETPPIPELGWIGLFALTLALGVVGTSMLKS
jgi:virginiamycin B lyase